MLLLQILIILATARVVGWLFRRIGQPAVVGEMVAGILLGPSAFGWIAPGYASALFPPASLAQLNALSQLGSVLFLFLVGLSLDLSHLQDEGRVTLASSSASILAPFAMGSALAIYLYPRFSYPHVRPLVFALFLGVAMSITAFPVLARILREFGLVQTRIGTVAIACAALDDVTAWTLLASIVALTRSGDGLQSGALTLLYLAIYLAVMWFGVRRLTRNWNSAAATRILLVALASSVTTEWLGMHALFGAFFSGVVMSKGKEFVDGVARKIEPLTVNLLLPLFFALTGLRTRIGLVRGLSMWLVCLAIIAVAVTGKWGGAMLAARLMGMEWRPAATLGILMNTRGLVELVILNIGLDLGVLSPELFSMMVIMALVTTFMTSPLLRLMGYRSIIGSPAVTVPVVSTLA